MSPLTGRRRALGALALAAFLLVFALGLLIDSPDEPAVVLYAIPVALLALAFGTWAGMLGGVLGAALFWVAGVYHDASYSAVDVGYRLIVLVALGALIGWLATRLGDAELAADVAERRRAENELRRSEASLAEAQRIAHLGSWEWDVQDDLVTWSDELHRICGLEPGSLDLSYEAFLERVHPDDRGRVDAIVRSSFETLKPFAFSYRALRPDGSERILDAHGDVVAEDGRIVRMAGTAHDVTERIEVEERLAVSAELRRRAVELNDTVVQGLAVAHYRLARNDPEAAEAVGAALARAKELVHDLLGDAAPEPGSLRRETPAGGAFTPFGE